MRRRVLRRSSSSSSSFLVSFSVSSCRADLAPLAAGAPAGRHLISPDCPWVWHAAEHWWALRHHGPQSSAVHEGTHCCPGQPVRLALVPLVAPVAWVVMQACFLGAAGLVLQEMLAWARGAPRPAGWGCWRAAQGWALAAAPRQRRPAAAATAPGGSYRLLLLGSAALYCHLWGSLHGSSMLS